jgi:hypothetical protein
VNTLDRDKLRIHALLKKERGVAHTAEELAAVTGMSASRTKAAGDSLAASGLVTLIEGYYMMQSVTYSK